MTPAVQVVLSGALTFGVPFVFAIRELLVLRRPGRGGGWRDPGPKPPEPTPKPLPDCLIPRLSPRPAPSPDPSPAPGRPRELEPA